MVCLDLFYVSRQPIITAYMMSRIIYNVLLLITDTLSTIKNNL